MDNKINPYMTADDVEKILLAEGIEIDEQIKMYLTEIQRVPPLTPETEKELLQNLDDKKKLQKLSASYLRFAFMIAKEYIGSMKLIDCIQNGNLGLMKATDSFDGNISFAEHAEKCIRNEINREIEHNKNVVRIPVFTYGTIERSLDENNSITIKKLAEVLKHNKFDARQISAIYRFCKRKNIKIVRSADPYINDDVVEKVLSSESIEIDKYLKIYLTEVHKIVTPLTPETEKQFLKNFDDKTTRTKLSEGYLRFVIMIAKEYIDGKSELIDLIASGNEGLRKAVESFDCTENISFSLLAEWLIRQEILEEVKRDKREIPIFYKRKK